MQIEWTIQKFSELTVGELYAILQLRNEVFVVEQNCVYQDLDNKDQGSFHLCGWYNEKLVAYSRLIPPGISFNEASIGRVVNSPACRHQGIGKELMKNSISGIYRLFGKTAIRIGAQVYLTAFYQSFGFVQDGEEYLEDGIPHIEMKLD